MSTDFAASEFAVNQTVEIAAQTVVEINSETVQLNSTIKAKVLRILPAKMVSKSDLTVKWIAHLERQGMDLSRYNNMVPIAPAHLICRMPHSRKQFAVSSTLVKLAA